MCLAEPPQEAATNVVKEAKQPASQEVVVIRNTFVTVIRVPVSIRCTSAPPCLAKESESTLSEAKSRPEAKRRGRRRAHRAKRGTDVLLPSRGSRNHFRGLCRPCRFSAEECPDGEMCNFCHHPHGSGETTPREDAIDESKSAEVASEGLAFSNRPQNQKCCESCSDGCWQCLNCCEPISL